MRTDHEIIERRSHLHQRPPPVSQYLVKFSAKVFDATNSECDTDKMLEVIKRYPKHSKKGEGGGGGGHLTQLERGDANQHISRNKRQHC